MSVAIFATNKETGHTSYYTGKVGGDWISPKSTDGFYGYAAAYADYHIDRIFRKDLFPRNLYTFGTIEKSELK